MKNTLENKLIYGDYNMGFKELIFGHLNKKQKINNPQYLKEYIKEIIEQNPKLGPEKIKTILLNKKKKEIEEKNIDYSRRNFLKNAGIGTILLTTAPNEIIKIVDLVFNKKILYEQNLNAYDITDFPPGIRNSRYKNTIGYMYHLLMDPDGLDYGTNGPWNKDTLCGMLGHCDRYKEPVKKEIMLREPAFWYIASITNFYPRDNIITDEELKEKNPSLYYFETGILEFMRKYRLNSYDISYKEIEKLFLTSIYVSLEKKQNKKGIEEAKKKAEEFMKMNLEEEKEEINKCIENFRFFKINPKDSSINSLYDRAIAAQWSSFFLVTNYYIASYRERSQTFKKKAQIIRELENNSCFNYKFKNKDIDLRIRGTQPYKILR